MSLSDLQFATMICWLFAVCFAFDALFHLLRTLYILVHCKLHSKPEALDSHEFSWLLIIISSVMFLNLSKAGCFPLIPAVICMSGWLFIPFCVILQKKLVSMKGWREYLEGIMERFFDCFENMRGSMLRMESFAKRCGVKTLLILVIIYAVWTPVSLFSASGDGFLAMMVLPMLIAFLLYAACNALHSCRKLLVFGFVHGILLTMCIVHLIPAQEIRDLSIAAAYVLSSFVFLLIWIVMAGVADDDVAKMAACIVNTGTTILVILINVLVGWGLNRLGDQAPIRNSLEQLQFFGNLTLLPLIISGYSAALLKEMQIYRRARCEEQDQQKQDG